MPRPKRLLLLAPKTSYRADAFVEAARRLGAVVRIGSDRCHQLAAHFGVPLALDYRDPDRAVRQVLAHARVEAFDAVLPTDDASTVIASRVAAALGLPANPLAAAVSARDKGRMRESLRAASVASPEFRVLAEGASDAEVVRAGGEVGWPCVVKPLLMSGSRGVIRADDPASLRAAFARVRRILHAPDVPPSDDPAARRLLVERFVPGFEVALEGLLVAGHLRPLALFDKPDPLDGPFFEETIYVTPSRLPPEVQEAVCETAGRAARAIGLERGAVHAELRVESAAFPGLDAPCGPPRVSVVEVAGRSIGGLCSRTLRFGTGRSLEEIVVSDALGLPLPPLEREAAAAGVMMLPIPARGILRQVKGTEAALAVAGIESVEITAPLDHEIAPLPEGSSYLGFLFARAALPAAAEAALRRAHRELDVVIAPNLVLPRAALGS